MHRLAALLLFAFTALVATAAPAPEPKPWVTGWDKPIDPKGDCSFERKGDELTVTIPGGGHQFDTRKGVLDAPRLLRNVEGDFGIDIRVSGDKWVAEPPGLCQRAGILVTDGESSPVLRFTFLGQVDEVRTFNSLRAEVKLSEGVVLPHSEMLPSHAPIDPRVSRASWRGDLAAAAGVGYNGQDLSGG